MTDQPWFPFAVIGAFVAVAWAAGAFGRWLAWRNDPRNPDNPKWG